MNFNISQSNLIPYFSKGNIQLYHVVEELLEQTGKADIFISSYTVSEEFIRKLFILKEKKYIDKLTMLIDSRNAQKTQHLSWFLASVANEVFLAENHSKVILINNHKVKVTVVTSQNQTRGNRYEAGIITTDPDIYAFYENQISGELSKCIKLHDVLRRNTNPD